MPSDNEILGAQRSGLRHIALSTGPLATQLVTRQRQGVHLQVGRSGRLQAEHKQNAQVLHSQRSALPLNPHRAVYAWTTADRNGQAWVEW